MFLAVGLHRRFRDAEIALALALAVQFALTHQPPHMLVGHPQPPGRHVRQQFLIVHPCPRLFPGPPGPDWQLTTDHWLLKRCSPFRRESGVFWQEKPAPAGAIKPWSGIGPDKLPAFGIAPWSGSQRAPRRSGGRAWWCQIIMRSRERQPPDAPPGPSWLRPWPPALWPGAAPGSGVKTLPSTPGHLVALWDRRPRLSA